MHRVVVGEHMGTNDGKITDITPSKIALVEIIPDGLGGYIERPAALGSERVIGRETHRMKRSILQTLRGRITLAGACLGCRDARGIGARAADAGAGCRSRCANTAAVDRRADAERQSAAADAAPVRAGARAAGLHHRQAGAHLPRSAQHHAGTALAPHRCRHRSASTPCSPPKPMAARASCSISISRCPTRPASAATTSWCWSAPRRHARSCRRQCRRRRAPHAQPRPLGRSGGRAIKSIDFRRSETGGGRLIVRLSRSAHADRPEAAGLADHGRLQPAPICRRS